MDEFGDPGRGGLAVKVFTRRNFAIAGGVLLLAIAGGAAWLAVADFGDLGRRIAEADRDDPGWKMGDLLAAQKADPIPEGQDSAILAAEAVKLLPAGWLADPAQVSDTPGGAQPAQASDPPRGVQLLGLLEKLGPGEALPPGVLAGLEAECQSLGPALAKARGLADRPRGRVAVSVPDVPVLMDFTPVQDLRQVARLLRLDAIRLAAAGDGAGALRDVRAILNEARSLRDVPSLLAQLVRFALDTVAVDTLVRVLGLGAGTSAELAALEALLQAEASEPLGVFALRSERASFHQLMTNAIEKDPSAGGMAGMGSLPIFGPRMIRYYHGHGLEMFAVVVEIARAPDREQLARFDELVGQVQGKQPGASRRSFGILADQLLPALRSAVEGGLRVRTNLNAARVLVALERARLADGKWPESAAALPTAILPEIPQDSFADAPLSADRLEDGWEVASVATRKSPAGARDPRGEIRLRLLDPERRGKPAEQPAIPEGEKSAP
jgi:hypothetical protein